MRAPGFPQHGDQRSDPPQQETPPPALGGATPFSDHPLQQGKTLNQFIVVGSVHRFPRIHYDRIRVLWTIEYTEDMPLHAYLILAAGWLLCFAPFPLNGW